MSELKVPRKGHKQRLLSIHNGAYDALNDRLSIRADTPGALFCTIHYHMLFLDGVYIDGISRSPARFRWVKAPTSAELTQLAYTIAQRIGRFLERQGFLERDAENSYLASDAVDEDPMTRLLGHSITYRIAVGPQQGRKVFTLQTLPACDPEDQFGDAPGNVAGFSLHAGVAASAHERDKLERLCRYIALHGCRVLRRLGTIASAATRPSRKSDFQSRRTATSVTRLRRLTGVAPRTSYSSHWISLQNWQPWYPGPEST